VRQFRRLFYGVLFLLVGTHCAFSQEALNGPEPPCKDPVVIYSVQGDYDEVWEDLKLALNDRGLVISSVSHVGEMIDRTGRALGRTRKVFAKANVMEFCSAIVSRNMLEQDPHLIAFCPYQIMVYSLPDEERKIYLSYRRPIWKEREDQAVLDSVERLVDGIIHDVIELHESYEE